MRTNKPYYGEAIAPSNLSIFERMIGQGKVSISPQPCSLAAAVLPSLPPLTCALAVAFNAVETSCWNALSTSSTSVSHAAGHSWS